MASVLPSALNDLIDSLSDLPGVGHKTAERYAYYLLKQDPHTAQKISSKLVSLHKDIAICPKTFALIDAKDSISKLYSDTARDKQLVAVVAEPFDIIAIESTNSFKGTYHVLGGLLSPLDNVGPEQLHITELISRIKEDEVKEIILATNASVEGETTAMYIQQQIVGTNCKLTRLARGLPIGVDIEYADRITLTRALEGRTSL
ncbi:recombination protein RecR [Candidatus Saccharibacteria bacterium]|nr:recombination protein RecR [Candidatus Saccharibacteria bacterium]